MKQSLIISSTDYFQVYLLTQKLRIFTWPLGKLNTFQLLLWQQTCITMVALKILEREFKVLLNFVRERMKHVYRINLVQLLK